VKQDFAEQNQISQDFTRNLQTAMAGYPPGCGLERPAEASDTTGASLVGWDYVRRY
jgi:hypothetical protein